MRYVSRFILLWIFSISPVLAADIAPLSAELQPLDRAVGKWVYHGEDPQTAYTKAGKWTWVVDCGWSTNRIFLLCSFAMDWPEGPNHSISVTTYNKQDKSYWHYEIADDDDTGDKPFVARMTVAGDTWTDSSGGLEIDGKTAPHFRVIYQYVSSTHVKVKFETSDDGVNWSSTGQGEGIKQP